MIGTLFAVAAVLFAIPFVPRMMPGRPAPDASPSPVREYRQAGHDAGRETRFKQQLVAQDMKATERLSRKQVERDAERFLGGGGKPGSVESLLTTHPEIEYVEWNFGNKTDKASDKTVDAGLMKAAEPHLAEARQLAGRQATAVGPNAASSGYSSPLFQYGGKSYFALSRKAKNGHSLVALVSSNVIQSVERHQRRNLRIVPYPAEGRYRIESVTPGTNKDTTVRKGEDNGNASHYAVDEIVVKFRKLPTERQLLQLRKELDLTVVRHTGRTFVFRSKKHETKALKAYFKEKWNPEYAEPHYMYLTNGETPAAEGGTEFVPNDTFYSEYQWNLPEIATVNGWNVTKGSKDVVVAVLDTGVQSDHPDLKERIVEGVNIVDPSAPPEDDVGHGTHVAGIIAAEINNNEGVAGMTWYTKIMPVKVLDSTGAGSTYSVAEGILWATDHGAQVINMSLGNYAEAEFLHDALKYAYERGVVIVAASGNDNTDRPGYPAAYAEVIGVSATDADETRAEYSNYGDYIDVAAPGTSIPSTYPGSQYAALSGTSMASPHVAALASLVKSAKPSLTNAQIAELLRRTAKDLGTKGKDNDFGYGQIDVRSALQAAVGTSVSLQLYPKQVRKELQKLQTATAP
ncbi:S8 family peptidase [Cohnella suwonensis]|uniref:S8 family peptidase n=1 Tax=Cohnella suwonensis TaxID=696072 RepID=A0ABW0LMX9_9BACL